MEIWKPVIGYEGIYEVSSIGRVKALARAFMRKSGRLQSIHERIRKQTSVNGYSRITLISDGVFKSHFTHLLVLKAFIGECPDGMECRHLNGNRSDNRIENLVWGTKLENAADRIAHGNQVRGSSVAISKLDEEKVKEIRLLLGQRISQQKIADMYGVNQTKISDVKTRRTWRHVT